MPEVVVRIQNVSMFIEGDLDPKVHDEIRRVMSYVVPGHEYMPQYKRSQIMAKYSKKDPWDGTKTVALHGYGWRGLKAPSGLYSYLKEVLARNEVYHRVVDERPLALPSPGYAAPTLVPRDYQQEQMIAPALDRQRGVMKASTGSGKTEVLVKIIVEAGVFPAFFYVTSCDLLRQAYNRFSKYVTKDGQPARIGRVGDGYCDIQPITISTVQSAQKALTGAFTKYSHDDYSTDDDTKFSEVQKRDIQDAVREAQFVYVDEAHHCSAQTIQDILNNSHKARWRIGGSASPWRDDGLDILIEACFGKRFCDITASYLIERGFLVKPIITFNHFR
jgi:superfamily II DNA or RNA helicase